MKVALAYSGGLDTSFCIAYLCEHYQAEVIAVTCDLGQKEDFGKLRQRALRLGAKEHILLDLKDAFFDRLLSKAIKANARYEKAYPLHSSLQGYLIVEKLVNIAKDMGASAIAHGNSGLGNDQFRYDIPARVFASDLEVIAPVREGSFTRQAEWDYLAERNLPLPDRPSDRLYSVADNVWGCFRGHTDDANNPAQAPPSDSFFMVERNESTVTEKETITIGFSEGIPCSIDQKVMSGIEVLNHLNEFLGRKGFGIIDYVESSVFGSKVRQTMEGPGALSIIIAHEDLERLTLTKRQLSTKHMIEQRWAEYVFEGLWVDPVCRDIEAYLDQSQKTVTGEVTLEVRYNSVMPIRRSSPYSLYREDLYDYEDSKLDHASGAAFAELWGRGTVVAATIHRNIKEHR
jgi:argininosuccinate synthase